MREPQHAPCTAKHVHGALRQYMGVRLDHNKHGPVVPFPTPRAAPLRSTTHSLQTAPPRTALPQPSLATATSKQPLACGQWQWPPQQRRLLLMRSEGRMRI